MKAKGKCAASYRNAWAAGMGLLVLAGCTGGAQPARKIAPVDVPLKIERLDRDLFQAAAGSGNFGLQLYAQYGEFFRLYAEDVLEAAALEDPRLPMVLRQFTQDPDWSTVQREADSVFTDMATQEAGFKEAFGRLKALFPDSLVPRIIAYNSGFNYGVLPLDSVLGFGVEWFVGKESTVVRHLSPEVFPQYRKDRMWPGMLVPSVVKGWLLVHYARDTRDGDLLENLVETGKVMALLDALLPGTDPALKFAFTPDQLAWCEAHEFNIWREIVGKELLYTKDGRQVDRFMKDGPFTSGLPRESPGHIGEWIGFRMVASYLRAHPQVTFAELFAMDDAQAILKTYKPR